MAIKAGDTVFIVESNRYIREAEVRSCSGGMYLVNESVFALKELCPLAIEMSMYGGFEQVGSLGSSLPRNDEQITTEYGDIVLYSGDQIVIFYGSNSWAYTKLGHILADKEIMEEALANGDVTIELVVE